MKTRLVKTIVLFLPFSLLVGTWLLWKVYYYGSMLPNTFYAKVETAASWSRGLIYVYSFFLSYLLFPFVFIALIKLPRILRLENYEPLLLASFIGLWLLYVVGVGGDFMEFRFLVPILPLLMLVIVWLIQETVQDKAVQIALMVMVFFGSLNHAIGFKELSGATWIATIRQLNSSTLDRKLNWDEIGRVLGAHFSRESGVTIATTAAGAIPFYSDLRTIDMHGLNEPWIARRGVQGGDRPGHIRKAPFLYLMLRKVNLGDRAPAHGQPSGQPRPAVWAGHCEPHPHDVPSPENVPAWVQIVEIPIDEDYAVAAIYLHEHPLIDQAIAGFHWKVFPIRRS